MELESCIVAVDAPLFSYTEKAMALLRGLKGHYETLYGVVITDDALKASVLLSARHLTGKQLPDKPIEWLVAACIQVKADLGSKPQVIEIGRAHV